MGDQWAGGAKPVSSVLQKELTHAEKKAGQTQSTEK